MHRIGASIGSGRPGRASAYQLSYATNDLDRARSAFADHQGVCDWTIVEAEVDLAGEAALIRVALAFSGAIQLEIIQPMGGADDLYRSALPSAGFAMPLHHVGFKVSSRQALSAIQKSLVVGGGRTVTSGTGLEAAGFFYHDTRLTLGHWSEYFHLSPDREAFHAALPRN